MTCAPLRVCSFESRRRDDMESLIRRHGGEPTVAPSMQEVPLEDNTEVFEFAEKLLAGDVEAVIFMTGVGARAMLESVERRHERDGFLQALRNVTVIVRGPKPTAVLREWGVPITLRAPEPNTWEDIVAVIDDSNVSLDGCRVAVQEYGQPSDDLYIGLRERGADVLPVPVYRWTLPDDTAPLEAAINRAIAPGFDVMMFTSAQQVRHVLQVADRLGHLAAWREAAGRCVIASIGPTCSDALREEGLRVDFEPSHPKMGTLVRETLSAAPPLLAKKHSE